VSSYNGQARDDAALMRRFEPVIRFTRGEKFFPMDVEPYVRRSGLWEKQPEQEPICLIPSGELTLDHLAQPHSNKTDIAYYLKFTEPLTIPELAAYNLSQIGVPHDENEIFRAGMGRLARVGYLSRLADAMFSLGLLARGRVPGDMSTAAAIAYKTIMATGERYHYYGRVVRENGWLALQYWFFYLFNDWRSGFFGINDHEADWEMVCLYLSEAETAANEDQACPVWVAYASHGRWGDDVRRRWDDPEVDKVGLHPVIYAGAGSHACHFQPGEYLTELTVPYLSPAVRTIERVQSLWYRQFHQSENSQIEAAWRKTASLFRIPFVDYARGDGVAIGPGQAKAWSSPQILSEDLPWVANYRGLWGLYTGDPFGGEDAPTGPMYNRDGSVRRAWYDPVGWAGLDKVPPPDKALEIVLKRQKRVAERRKAMLVQIEEKSRHLAGLGVEAAALNEQPALDKMVEDYQTRISDLSTEVDHLRAQVAADQTLLQSLQQYEAQLLAGQRGPLRDHIRRERKPASEDELRRNRLAEVWAALSIGLVMLGFVYLVFFARQYLFHGLVGIIYVVAFIEASFHGRLANFVANVSVILATAATLVILYEFFLPIITLMVLVAGGYILWDNARELWT